MGQKNPEQGRIKSGLYSSKDHRRLPKTCSGQAYAQHCYARWHLVETLDKKTELRHLAKMFICRILLP